MKRPVALVVDDEPLILMDTADLIAEVGYSVVEAASAEEAFRFIVDNPDLQLLFTDVQTGGPIEGLELAREVARRWPHINVVVASGARRPGPGDLPDGAEFVSKPLSASLVHDVIKRHRRTTSRDAPHY